jgi:DNA-binding cell septation regulator SpoVG
LRRAEAATFGPGQQAAPDRAPVAKIRRWTPLRTPAGTILGYVDVELPSGMIVNGCKLMVGPNGRHWVALPSQKQTNRDGTPRLDTAGKQTWADIIEFVGRDAREKFQNLVLEALRRAHPEAEALEP